MKISTKVTKMLAIMIFAGTVSAMLFLISPLPAIGTPGEDGAALFKAKCSGCHGPDGSGKTPMGQKLSLRDLNSAEVQKQSDTQLLGIITKGKGKMPAFEKSLSQDQVQQLVSHIRAQAKKR